MFLISNWFIFHHSSKSSFRISFRNTKRSTRLARKGLALCYTAFRPCALFVPDTLQGFLEGAEYISFLPTFLFIQMILL